MARAFDWSEFEAAVFEELRWSLVKLGKAHKAERFYAVALYGLYRELDGFLGLPLLGANTEAAGPADAKGDFWAERWNPHGWAHTELPLRKRPTLRLEKALMREATAGTVEHWRRTEQRYFKVLVRLARGLRDDAPELLNVTDDFVAFVHDDEGGPALARKTIAKRRFESLFRTTVASAQAKADAANLAPADRAAFLVTRFGHHGDGVTSEDAQRQLLDLADDAIPAVLGALADDNAWLAAKLLGTIGIATDQVIAALRAHAPTLSWAATALGMLGDHDWLAAQTNAVAVPGMTAGFKAWMNDRRQRPAVDYRPLERYLDAADAATKRKIADELAPGRSYVSATADDVDEALRALASKHAVVRWHATDMLGNRGLGASVGKRVLPALADRLTDEHELVRRLAVISVTEWKALAKPYRGRVAELAGDPDETIRNIVGYALGNS